LRLTDIDDGETIALIAVPKDKVEEFRRALLDRDIHIEEEDQHVFETVDALLDWLDKDE
jgi:hypothetical protein